MTNAQRERELSTARWLRLGGLVLALLVPSGWGVYTTLTGANSVLIWDFHPPWAGFRAMLREGAGPYRSEYLLWLHQVISPTLPASLIIALLALSPRVARGDLR